MRIKRIRIIPQAEDPHYHDITAKRGGQWLGALVYDRHRGIWGLESDSDTIWTKEVLRDIVNYMECLTLKPDSTD